MHNTGRTVFIGGSNLGRIAKAATENGHMIVDLTAKGWIPKSGKIDRLFETLKKLNLTEIDTVVIDSMSNTAYLGTDEDGLPIPAEKSVEDGWYHLNGDLQLAPHSAFKSTMKLVEKIISNTGGAKVMLTVPLPRYVTTACCADTTHVSNRQDPDFFREISGSEKSLSDAATAGALTSEAKIINILEFFWSARVPFAGTSNSPRDQHLGRRRGPLDLKRYQGCRHEADEGHRRRERDAGACNKESQAGVCNSSEGQHHTGSKGHTAGPVASAQAGTAPALAVWPAPGEPARIQQPAGSAARRAGRPHHERKPAGGREGG